MREGYITRDEAIALVNKYDCEFPHLYFKEFLEFVNLSENDFFLIADKWRNKNIWIMRENEWVKKYPVK